MGLFIKKPFAALQAEANESGNKDVYKRQALRNILGKIEGKNPNEIVIIGAHYDHIGYEDVYKRQLQKLRSVSHHLFTQPQVLFHAGKVQVL